MIGIVVVSHSAALARAVVDLALAMVPGDRPVVEIAAGAGEDAQGVPILGTDAIAVADAIRSASNPDGVLVLMDLGSAVLSTQMALEFIVEPKGPVKLTSAPIVEGLVAAVVRAAGGASLEDVEHEARGALAAKASQLDEEEAEPAPGATQADAASPATVTKRFTLVNPSGLHARPIASVVTALAAYDAVVTVTNVRSGRGPARANSTIALLTLGAVRGDEIEVSATGPQAAQAVATVERLVSEGFGEGTG